MSEAIDRMYDEAVAKINAAIDVALASDGPAKKWQDTVSVTWGLPVHEGHTLYVPSGFGPVTVVESRFVTKPVMVNRDALKAALQIQDAEREGDAR